MDQSVVDVAKVSTVAGGSWAWMVSGMPWGDITIIGGAIYVLMKILLILPDLKEKYFGKSDSSA